MKYPAVDDLVALAGKMNLTWAGAGDSGRVDHVTACGLPGLASQPASVPITPGRPQPSPVGPPAACGKAPAAGEIEPAGPGPLPGHLVPDRRNTRHHSPRHFSRSSAG